MIITKGYCEGRFGEIHWRMAREAGNAPDLYCLQPAPFSGLAFTGMIAHVAKERWVIAPDFPEHGSSDPFRADPPVADYAAAIVAQIDELPSGGPVDVIDFHNGCLVAAELSLADPQLVRRLVLLDIPDFDPATPQEVLASSAQPSDLVLELQSSAPLWDRGITRRIDSQSMDRAFEMFTEQLRHCAVMHGGFHAGLTYDVGDRLPQNAST